MCHKTSPLGIHPAEEYVLDGAGKLWVNSTNAGAIPKRLNSLIATYGAPYFNGWADAASYGPDLGPDISRSDAAIKTWAPSHNLTQAAINKVKAAMNCSLCHSADGMGPLNYPEATRHGKTQANQIYQYISQGWMPPGNSLLPNEREALFECLVKEYLDFDKGEGLFVDWLKNTSGPHMSPLLAHSLTSGSGETDFIDHCSVCHTRVAGEHDYGPSLFGVVGRKSGGVAGYSFSSSYTEAGSKGVIWTEESLLSFLSDPVAFLSQKIEHPAVSRMKKPYPDETLRRSIIEYLKSLK
jgi:cytochrome c2/cytochrome c553